MEPPEDVEPPEVDPPDDIDPPDDVEPPVDGLMSLGDEDDDGEVDELVSLPLVDGVVLLLPDGEVTVLLPVADVELPDDVPEASAARIDDWRVQ